MSPRVILGEAQFLVISVMCCIAETGENPSQISILFVQLLEISWSAAAADDSFPQVPCFLDVVSGPNFPLSVAFACAGWNVLQPVDLEINKELDVTKVSTQKAIADALPAVHVVSCAMDCSTKSKIREIPLPGGRGPAPLRSSRYPRGLPGLPESVVSRVTGDNCCSDFVLAIQHVMNPHGRGAFRENPVTAITGRTLVRFGWVSNRGGMFGTTTHVVCLRVAVRNKGLSTILMT